MSDRWFEDRRERYGKTKAVIVKHFPIAFNPDFPLPLHHDVKAHIKSLATPLNLNDDDIDVFFRFWTERTEYIEAAVIIKHRYDVYGNRVKEISERDLAYFTLRKANRRPKLHFV